MGKFFDALQKSKAVANHSTSSKLEPHRRPSRGETSLSPAEMAEALRLKPQACQVAALDELLICCREDGNREIDFAVEQYKMLCTKLFFPAARPIPKTILITSAIPGEGKSFVSSNLAVSIALRKKQHALLIECDLRRPSLVNIFGISNRRGLSDYLSEEGELSNYLHKTAIDKLTVLPAGSSSKDPYGLLTSDRMMKLLTEIRDHYKDEYVIVDSTPVQVAAETSALSKFVDGVILVVRYGKTSKKLVQETVEIIGKDKILGVVLNAFEGTYTNEYYYKYYNVTDSKLKKMTRIFSRK